MERTIHIEGMSCNHCKMSVEKALLAVPGVQSAVVDLEKKQARVQGVGLDDNAIRAAITEAGFEVTGIE